MNIGKEAPPIEVPLPQHPDQAPDVPAEPAAPTPAPEPVPA